MKQSERTRNDMKKKDFGTVNQRVARSSRAGGAENQAVMTIML